MRDNLGNERFDEVGYQYSYGSPDQPWNVQTWAVLSRILATHVFPEKRAFEIGCGNGATAQFLHELGFSVTGVDSSESGIVLARRTFPEASLHVGNVYDDLAATYGTFPLVVSLEVIEHCFHPRRFARTFVDLLQPGGLGILSTPYHGYWKNLALAIVGRWDAHLGPLWDGGHIKFFSMRTLGALLGEVGFREISFVRVGRIPPLAKTMIATARR
jgi:2-polyprenyl-6-hydroxyphenyl methylase/3-demethylubiquinone-9 3-methyltransferase